MTSITPQALYQKIAAKQSLILINVRAPREFAGAHVPGATLEPLDSLDTARLARQAAAAPGTPLYVLCQGGTRARRAIESLERAGVPGCVLVEGGTQGWAEAGLPLEKQAVGGISLERQVRIAAGAIVFVGTLLGAFWRRELLVIPGFVGAGLVFAGVTDKCGMGMLLARMPWNQLPARGEGSSCGCCKS